jgi:purine nucleosidase
VPRDVTVEAVTVVAGNVGLPQASRNARYTVELCGAHVPVFEGAARPLLREAYSAQYFHGQDGLGDRGYPAPRTPPASGHAVHALIDVIRAHPGLTLVTLGPLTNIALACSRPRTSQASWAALCPRPVRGDTQKPSRRGRRM